MTSDVLLKLHLFLSDVLWFLFADMLSEKCKLPAYVPHDPLLWFRAVEANFQIHKVLRELDWASLVIAALLER